MSLALGTCSGECQLSIMGTSELASSPLQETAVCSSPGPRRAFFVLLHFGGLPVLSHFVVM